MEEKEEAEDQKNSQKHFECLSDVSWKPVGGLLGRLGVLLVVQGGSWASWGPHGASRGCSSGSWDLIGLLGAWGLEAL